MWASQEMGYWDFAMKVNYRFARKSRRQGIPGRGRARRAGVTVSRLARREQVSAVVTLDGCSEKGWKMKVLVGLEQDNIYFR